MKVNNMWQKLLDELVSRTVIMAVLFAIPTFFVTFTPENAKIYLGLAGMAVGGGYLKTIQNALKSKFEKQAKE